MKGLYGPAFYPGRNNTHLTRRQRAAIYALNSGKISMDISPEYMKAMKDMQALGDKVRPTQPGS
jgi:hypothetical protein